MENKIEPISLELSQNLKDFISEQERLRKEFWDYANKVIGIPKEKLRELTNKEIVCSKYPDAYERVYASRSMVIWCPLLNCRLSGFFLTFDEAWADAVKWIENKNKAK